MYFDGGQNLFRKFKKCEVDYDTFTHAMIWIMCINTCVWFQIMNHVLYNQNWLDEGYTYLKLYLLYSLVHMMQQTKKYQIKISISACLFTQGLHPYREGRSDLLPLSFSVCARTAGSAWWGLSRAQLETVFYLENSLLTAWYK